MLKGGGHTNFSGSFDAGTQVLVTLKRGAKSFHPFKGGPRKAPKF